MLQILFLIILFIIGFIWYSILMHFENKPK